MPSTPRPFVRLQPPTLTDAEPAPRPVLAAVERPRVWLLEDSPMEAEVARRPLAVHYDVVVFRDGAELLERLAAGPIPDALVLDWHLPNISGIEVCRFVRHAHDAVALPVLMVTVQGHKADIVQGLEAGANDYLTKPYDPSELLARVGTLARTRDAHRRRAETETRLAALLERERLRTDRATRLQEVTAGLSGAATPAHIAQVVASAGLRALDATGCLVAALGPSGCALELLDLEGYPEGYISRYREIPLDADVAVARCARERAPLFFTSREAYYQEFPAQRAEGLLRSAFAALPLVAGERLLGVLGLTYARDQAFDAEERAFALTLAQQCAQALDRVESLAAAERAREEAERSNRAKDEFLATMSHELRTPLTAIQGWTRMLRQGALAPEKRERALEIIERNAETQLRLVEDLLDVSRIAAGKLALDMGEVDPVREVGMSVDAVRLAAEAGGVKLVASLPERAGPVVGDATRLRQVVWNLLSNAVKFTPRGGRVEVQLEQRDGVVRVRVTDTGRGIDPVFLPHVFERFRQEDDAARGRGGLGLGLAICKHLVELHGGTITARSEGEGRGATFEVSLPVAGPR